MKEDAVVIDVRTSFEFKNAHLEGSINIPLDTLPSKIHELKKMNRVLFTTAGIPLTVRLTDNYFIIRDRTGDQIIQFLH